MNKRKIQFIVALMSIALFGIAIIQFYWIKWSVDLNRISFDDSVYMAMNKVHDHLKKEAESFEATSKYLDPNIKNPNFLQKDNEPSLHQLAETNSGFLNPNSKSLDNWNTQSTYYNEIIELQSLFKPNILLSNIDPTKLDEYLKQEVFNQNIELGYDYGIFSNESNNFSIINGVHVVEIDEKFYNEAGIENLGLYNTPYEVKLFGSDKIKSPGSLKIFFPTKTEFLLSSVWKALLSSLIFTGLILFSFIYTINVILRQKKVSEMKNDFINNMTHEFKTPIATISLAADSITSPKILSNESKVMRFADIIKQENRRMLSQVEKVLQMAMLEKEEFELRLEDVDIHSIIEQAVVHTDLKIQKKGGHITKKLTALNPIIQADQTHLTSVIHNLLDNANKYSGDKPEITISTTNKSNGVEISVTDKGIGMKKDVLKSIFDKFYRVHTGNLHDVKGFGLGLSYVKVIMDAHNGSVNVKSELGKGSTFSLFFPYKVSD